ncbi:MAG: carbohydrate ABC transporter permease, partial [Myxococcota bacterium]
MREDDVHPTLRTGALVLLVLVALAEVTPYLWMVSTSFKSLPEVMAFPPTLLPTQPMWSNYTEVWNSAPFGDYILNSIIIATAIMFIQGVLACLAGYAFARMEFPGRDIMFYMVIA